MTMAEAVTYEPSTVEQEEPDLVLTDPEPIGARHALRLLLEASALDRQQVDDLVGAVSEVVTNARLYGRPPVRLAAWDRDRQAIVTVSDGGEGPADPDAGVRPAKREVGAGGLGLWMARQMCEQVVMGRHADGFTIRLVVGSA